MEYEVGKNIIYDNNVLQITIAKNPLSCEGCFFLDKGCINLINGNIIGSCLDISRKDNKSIYYKKLDLSKIDKFDSIIDNLKNIIVDINNEIVKNFKYPNIGKNGCRNRLQNLIEKYRGTNE